MEKSLEVMVKMLDMHGLRYRMEGKKFLYGETASNMTKPATQQDSLVRCLITQNMSAYALLVSEPFFSFVPLMLVAI